MATFVLGLAISIALGLPLIGCAALVGGTRFEAMVDGFVRRLISSGGARLAGEPVRAIRM